MTPLRSPPIVTGAVPGLLTLGVPVRGCDDDSTGAVVCDYRTAIPEPLYRVGWGEPRGEEDMPGRLLLLDWDSPLAIYAALNWLADHGHPRLWALPSTHGGKVKSWDGLSAWEVSAVIAAASVLRVAGGGRPISDLYCQHEPGNPLSWSILSGTVLLLTPELQAADLVEDAALLVEGGVLVRVPGSP